jgi:hypothetical protein
MTEPAVRTYSIKPLGPDTWEAFAQLAEKHNGVWGGCWCTWFHPRRKEELPNNCVMRRTVSPI